jgi:uncharacterized membrane protein (DUF373 family)
MAAHLGVVPTEKTVTASHRVVRFYERFERLVVFVLLVLLSCVILYMTVQFAAAIFRSLYEVASHYLFRRGVEEVGAGLDVVHDVFAQFLLILIGLELMKTVLMYLEDHVVHVEVVLTVAIIAIARHAIDINYKEVNPLVLLGTGLLVLALTLGYYLFKRADAGSSRPIARPDHLP